MSHQRVSYWFEQIVVVCVWLLLILVCRGKFKKCLELCHHALHLLILFVSDVPNYVEQSSYILVRHYLIPCTVCFQHRLQIWGAVLQTQIVDICIAFYPCDFFALTSLYFTIYLSNLIPYYLSSNTGMLFLFSILELSILYYCMGLDGLKIVGCDIFSITFEPISLLSLLPMCLASLLLTIPNSADAFLFPWVKCTSSSPGAGSLNLLLGVSADAVLMFLFIQSILTFIYDNFVEKVSLPSYWMAIGDISQDCI